MIAFDGVVFSREGRELLRIPALELTERRIGLIGANGAGKSTFSRLLNGLLVPSEGEVTIDGLSTRSDGKKVRRKVGFVFQNPDNQIVMPTVGEDLAFGLKNLGFEKQELARKIDAALAHYGLSDLRDRLTHQLSAGEKQLVAIAGVTVMDPAYIIFDEPTTLLDLGNKKKVMATIDGLSQNVILVSHDLDLLGSFDRVICLHDGKVHADGRPDDVIAAYKALFP
ncbi:MAG: ATP-binding cassette domain-containing protein [Rhodospirillales bacterium]